MGPSTIDPIGRYCGRFHAGWLGEPQNSFTNLGFIIAAIVAWRSFPRDDRFGKLLAILATTIGVGSFLFHSHPTRAFLQIDLVPIQVFTLVYVAFAWRRFFAARWSTTLPTVIAFAVGGAAWQSIARGILGGAASHLLGLLGIFVGGLVLRRRRTGRRLLAAAGSYFVALVVRASDLPMCAAWPIGVHWLWHLLQGLTMGLLLLAAAASVDERSWSRADRANA